MTNPHPITPPTELVEQWREKWSAVCGPFGVYIATQAARWGADQELEAVEEEIIAQGWFANSVHRRAQLRNARRPKPPSLKEQAMETLNFMESEANYDKPMFDTIRRALEALDG